MAVYKYTDFSNAPTNFSFVLQKEDISGLDACYIDPHAIECLGFLIDGPIESFEQILSAELYVRALLFHEQIRPISPCIDVTRYSGVGENPFKYSHCEQRDRFKSIDLLYSEVKHHSHICPIEWITVFSEPLLEEKIVGSQNAFHEQNKWRLEEHKKSGYMMDARLGRYVKVCDQLEDYFDEVFRTDVDLINKFLIELPKSTIPSYLADPTYLSSLSRSQDLNPLKRVLEHLDCEWAEVEKSLRYNLNVVLPPFVYMAISIAKKREDIPYAILEMRDKFKKDRESLWELLDDAKQRSGADPLMAHKIFKNIEGKISRIMQEFSCGYNVKKDLFSVINAGLYLFNLNSGGLFSPSETFSNIQQLGSMMQSYPVPNLLESLQNIEWDSTMRHFSEAEILCLRKSLGY